MEIIFCDVKGGNFGDHLNVKLWPALLPNISSIAPNEAILGVGTLQGMQIPQHIQKVHLFGTGAYADDPGKWLDKNKFQFHFVRGPLTAERWGCPGNGLIDGAALILHCSLKDAPIRPSKKIGYIPHHTSDNFANYQRIADLAGFEYISTLGYDTEKFISQVKSCDYIITEALHGAILADLFRKPWCPVRSGDYINEFKWSDWAQSIGFQYEPHMINKVITRGLKPIHRIENAYKRGFSFMGIGKKRWARKIVFYDPTHKEDQVVEQLIAIERQSSYILSKDSTFDHLINRAGEIWLNFKKNNT